MSQVYRDGFAYDVSVILDENHRSDIADISAITVDTPAGEKISLDRLAEIRSDAGPNTVNRENVGGACWCRATWRGPRPARYRRRHTQPC